MAAEPSEDLISTVEAFTGCTRTVAIRALKVKKNDAQAAVNAVFEGENLENLENDLAWNETLMSNVPLSPSAPPLAGPDTPRTVPDVVASGTAAPPAKLPAASVPPMRICGVCCEPDDNMIRPCFCPFDWCPDCLQDRFVQALSDKSMFPARCCAMIQLHIALPLLTNEEAQEYRLRFEEWISPSKTYCPSLSCSAFIPDRLMEKAKSTEPITISEFLRNILAKVNTSQHARFFREEPDITQLPGHTSVVANPIYLTEMQSKLERYTSTEELTQDVQLILSNAQLHGSGHPIAQAATQLFDLYLHELSESITAKLLAGTVTSFACPTCQVAICAGCKNIEHRGQACDTSRRDEELAMLAKFGYKQCPRCNHGVRKMYGCSHIVCRCGAGWCWTCTRSIDVCGGDCGYDEEEEEEHVQDEIPAPGSSPMSDAETPPQDPDQVEPRNLDAGGEALWHRYDLGPEPEEDPILQVWSCEHTWRKYRENKDGFFHGYPQDIECNRCFKKCPSGKGVSKCSRCLLLVCPGCKESYKSSRTDH